MTAYQPDWRVHPGEVLAELLADRDLSQAELARATGYSFKHINRIIKGHAAVTAEMAVRLEIAIGPPVAQFWMNLQSAYDIWEVKQQLADHLHE